MSRSEFSLGEVSEVRRGTSITKPQTRPGNIPVVAGGMTPTYFHDTPNRSGNVITISASGASAGYVNFWTHPIFASDCSTVTTSREDIDIKYLFYFLRSQQDYINSKLRSGAAQPHVYAKDIAELRLQVPPINI
ncbi:MAG: restriction endonuclease subunit S, partial [Polaromonas sp.]|nr:restriction endonuclease subunit S [Polaromonas sp.]